MTILEEDAKYRRDRCMACDKPPEYEVLWAEGMAHAWFCELHLKEWLKKSVVECAKEGFFNKNCEVNSVKKLDEKEASKKFSENKNGNIMYSFLSQITMPEVNREKEEVWSKQKSIGLRDEEELSSEFEATAPPPLSSSAPPEINEELAKKDCTICDLEVCSKECFNSHPGSTVALFKLINTKGFVISTESKDKELAPVNSSGIELGEEITVEEIKPFFKSFYRTKPYVSIIGGLCTQGKTKGDIDIFIRSARRDIATEFRIIRSFPEKYWFRFQFHYPYQVQDHPGVFTNYLDIFNEKIEVISNPELVLMSVPKKVELFKFFPLLKPMMGRRKMEEFTIDNLISVVNDYWDYSKKIAVQRKFDGLHVIAMHSKEGKVKIYTEEGNEITDKCPSIVSELKEVCKGHDVIVPGELESWTKKKHNPRQRTAAIILSKGIHEDEKTLKLNMFDCLYYK